MTDYLIAMCDSCGHHVRVSLEHGGRRAKCPKCAAIIDIPRTESGILRLRTDTELTREARAKAGRGDPDSDPTVPVADRGSSSRSSGGRHTTVHRRLVHPSGKGRRVVLIVSLVATLGIMIAIGVILLKKPPGAGEAVAPPPTAPPPKPPPPAPPKPAPVENETEREEILDRMKEYIKAFNTNDIDNKIAPFHDCDLGVLRKAFGSLGDTFLVTYDAKLDTAKFDWVSKREARVTFKCRRTFTVNNTYAYKELEKTLTWVFKEDEKKWKISSPPEP